MQSNAQGRDHDKCVVLISLRDNITKDATSVMKKRRTRCPS
jgi:hypothetical protein